MKSPANTDKGYFFLQIEYFSVSFPCLSSVARISNDMLNTSVYILVLIPDFRKGFQLFTIEYVVNCGLVIKRPILCWYVHLSTYDVSFGFMNKCWILSNAFPAVIGDDHVIIISPLFGYLSVYLRILSHYCIPEINQTRSWCMILYIYFWI